MLVNYRSIIKTDPHYMNATLPSEPVEDEWVSVTDISALCPVIYYIGTGEKWKNILEIGTGPYAKSTITLSELMIHGGSLLTVDMVEKHSERVPKKDNVHFLCAKTGQDDDKIISEMHKLNMLPLDCLFIDGDHRLSAILYDFNKYNQFVRKEGFILFHDIALLMPDHDGPTFWKENNFDGFEKLMLGFNNGLGILRKI